MEFLIEVLELTGFHRHNSRGKSYWIHQETRAVVAPRDNGEVSVTLHDSHCRATEAQATEWFLALCN